MNISNPYGMNPEKLNDVCIDAHPRIHMGLISMLSDGPRLNGGIGFAITQPTASVRLERARDISVEDRRVIGFNDVELSKIISVASASIKKNCFESAASITITGTMPTHMGVGSGTAIMLAIQEALHVLNGREYTETQIVELSMRGGTSGIGVATYFSGGAVLDVGAKNVGQPIQPSSLGRKGRAPRTLPTVEMPEWDLCLCYPIGIRAKTQEEEQAFFLKNTPLSKSAAYEACYHAVFGVYASLLESDYKAFCEAVEKVQRTEWKAREWGQYGDSLFELRRQLIACGADCVGMSSLGPMLYCFGSEASIASILCRQGGDGYVAIATSVRNEGRAIVRERYA